MVVAVYGVFLSGLLLVFGDLRRFEWVGGFLGACF